MVKIPVHDHAGVVVAEALVDDDFSSLATLRWHLHAKGYVYRQVRLPGDWRHKKTIYLHRLVMGEPPGQHVDHLDTNPLNCQRSNLEVVPGSVNSQRRWSRRRPSTPAHEIPV